AIAELFNDSVKMIVSARALNGGERAAQKALHVEVTEFRIAMDALAVIVNEANDVTRLTLTQLDSIFTGGVMDWGLLGWRGSAGKISVFLPDRNMAAYEVFASRVLGGRAYTTAAGIVTSSPGMIAAVEKEASAVGIVGLNWLRNTTARIRILELMDPAAPDSLEIGGKYFSPHQAYIYKQFYPLARNVYIYSTPDSYGVSSGFTSFITSAAGQKIVQSQGLVPATMPVRLVELRNNGI
ncbi:MAG TPA: substrate-binding domain-containing protein, partial [Bacteroidota bacterium]|nr:substrate-binding domain-containing protein [Bacteroidota bacterium]